MIVEIFVELNKLDWKFQCDHVDIKSIASTIDVIIPLLQRQYLTRKFGRTSKYLEKFLQDVVPTEQVFYNDKYRVDKVHSLDYEHMLNYNMEGTLEH